MPDFNSFVALLLATLQRVAVTLQHNWPYLLLSIVIAVLLKLFVDADVVGSWLNRHRKAGVVGATAAAVATPLCSCGTTAVLLGMMASTLPWAPIVAFMVASPLTSPQEFVYSAGLFGWPFAWAFFIASIVLGLVGGGVAALLDARGWLKGQARFERKPKEAPAALAPTGAAAASTGCGCGVASTSAARTSDARPATARSVGSASAIASECCGGAAAATLAPAAFALVRAESSHADRPRVTGRQFAVELLSTGQRLLAMFLGFAFIGYFLNGLIPSAWISTLFGSGNTFGVPLAATLGLPLYVNSEASLPLVRAMIDNGMTPGAALAFLITGAGTSIGAIAGALTIARWRVIAIVVATLWLGAIACGGAYDALAAAGLW